MATLLLAMVMPTLTPARAGPTDDIPFCIIVEAFEGTVFALNPEKCTSETLQILPDECNNIRVGDRTFTICFEDYVAVWLP